MEWLWLALPALACGAMMLVICVPMLLGRKHNDSNERGASQKEVAELREEIALLKAERALEQKSEVRHG